MGMRIAQSGRIYLADKSKNRRVQMEILYPGILIPIAVISGSLIGVLGLCYMIRRIILAFRRKQDFTPGQVGMTTALLAILFAMTLPLQLSVILGFDYKLFGDSRGEFIVPILTMLFFSTVFAVVFLAVATVLSFVVGLLNQIGRK
jgi:hypothetical protein